MSPVTKQSLAGKDEGGEAQASPSSQTKGKSMAKVKLRILMPTAFEAQGIKTWKTETKKIGDREYEVEIPGGQIEVVEVEEKLAADLIAAGHAEKA